MRMPLIVQINITAVPSSSSSGMCAVYYTQYFYLYVYNTYTIKYVDILSNKLVK